MADTTKKKVEIEIGARDDSRGAFRSLEDRLNSVKRQFGRRGLFGDLGEILTGGGIVAGVTFLGRELSSVVKTANELTSAFATGAISAGELTERIAGSIPVLGEFWQLGRNIQDAMSGAAIEAAKLVVETKRALEASRLPRQAVRGARASIDSVDSFADALAEDAFLLGARPDEVPLLSVQARKSTLLKKIIEESDRNLLRAGDNEVARNAVLEARRQSIEKLQESYEKYAVRLKQVNEAEKQRARDEAAVASIEERLKNRRIKEQEDIVKSREMAAFSASVVDDIRRMEFLIQESSFRNRASFPGFATLTDTGGSGANDAAREAVRIRFESESLEVQKQSRDAVVAINEKMQQSNAVLLGVFR